MNTKTGLDYFPFDIDFFQDEKIQFVSARFGVKGEAITIRLLCKIYRNGYYTKWDNDTALLFAKGVGDGCSDSCVNDVVHELVKRGFFDKSIFDRFGILTSRGIQKRFLEAGKRRKDIVVDENLMLVDVSDYQNVNIVNQFVDNKAENADILKQSKVKESKVNRKEKESKVIIRENELFFGEFNNVHLLQYEYDKLIEKYGKRLVDLKIASLDTNIQDGIKKYINFTNHYLTINRWCIKSAEEAEKKSKHKGGYEPI